MMSLKFNPSLLRYLVPQHENFMGTFAAKISYILKFIFPYNTTFAHSNCLILIICHAEERSISTIKCKQIIKET